MKSLILLLAATVSTTAYAQVFTNKEVGKKNVELRDSLKQSDYPYSLPIWGDKATKAGFNLPYSAGLSAQYFTTASDLVINNLSVGFNNNPMYNLDGIVRFDDAKARGSAITVRPDIWLFPFLNIYGILGKSQASTKVGFGIWIPDSTDVAKEVLKASTTVDFNTTTFGIGMTPTIGVGGGFLAMDINMAWTDVPQLSKPARSFVFAPRFGKAFKLKKPESNIAVWVGAFRATIASETNGSLALSEVIEDGGEAGAKIDQAILRVENAQVQVDTWWNNLSGLEQNSPINKAKYEAANAALARTGEILSTADQAITTISNSTVQYSMTKQMKDPWNFIVGSQYQLNKHFMIRAEVGFLGSRNQVLAGVQYRFGL